MDPLEDGACELVRVVTGALAGPELPPLDGDVECDPVECDPLVRVVTGALDATGVPELALPEPDAVCEALVRVVTAPAPPAAADAPEPAACEPLVLVRAEPV